MPVKYKTKIPKYFELMNPLLKAIKELGGSGTNDEIYKKVVDNERFTEEQLSILHNPEKDSRTEIGYRLAWTQTYLKKYDLINNTSAKGVWSITKKGKETETVNPDVIVDYVKSQKLPKEKDTYKEAELKNDSETFQEDENNWKNQLHQLLLNMPPASFERLTQRLLREVGFIEVEVTGKSGDGGIDGKGILKLNDLFDLRVVFQCKRYKGSVGPSEIRDFRGGADGRGIDKRLFITTGSFTRDAIKEANRDGALPVDLINGEQLVNKLKGLSLGLKTNVKTMEEVEIDREWFEEL